jgi:hypothetical protein
MAGQATGYSDFFKNAAGTKNSDADGKTSFITKDTSDDDALDPSGAKARKKALQRRLKTMKMRTG